MRLSHVRIRNFSSIRELDLDFAQICALVRPNNAGKSNILVAISRVLERGWVRASDFDERDVFHHDPEADVEIDLTFEPGISYRRFKVASPVEVSMLSFKLTRYQIGAQRGERRLEQAASRRRASRSRSQPRHRRRVRRRGTSASSASQGRSATPSR